MSFCSYESSVNEWSWRNKSDLFNSWISRKLPLHIMSRCTCMKLVEQNPTYGLTSKSLWAMIRLFPTFINLVTSAVNLFVTSVSAPLMLQGKFSAHDFKCNITRSWTFDPDKRHRCLVRNELPFPQTRISRFQEVLISCFVCWSKRGSRYFPFNRTLRGDTMSMVIYAYLHKALRKIKWSFTITRLTAHFMCGLISDLVILQVLV